jgi:hypothetical protein
MNEEQFRAHQYIVFFLADSGAGLSWVVMKGRSWTDVWGRAQDKWKVPVRDVFQVDEFLNDIERDRLADYQEALTYAVATG